MTDTPSGDTTVARSARVWNQGTAVPHRRHTVKGIEAFLGGLEPWEPGTAPIPFRRPTRVEAGLTGEIARYGGVARRP